MDWATDTCCTVVPILDGSGRICVVRGLLVVMEAMRMLLCELLIWFEEGTGMCRGSSNREKPAQNRARPVRPCGPEAWESNKPTTAHSTLSTTLSQGEWRGRLDITIGTPYSEMATHSDGMSLSLHMSSMKPVRVKKNALQQHATSDNM